MDLLLSSIAIWLVGSSTATGIIAASSAAIFCSLCVVVSSKLRSSVGRELVTK
jgi:hypothetical protein